VLIPPLLQVEKDEAGKRMFEGVIYEGMRAI
jgi:hypothetical protein